MKTFEQEYKELINWMKKKNQEYDEAIDKDTTGGRDGELVYQRAQVVKEYNKRLLALKKKYGKNAESINTMAQESNSPKADRARI